MEYIHIPKRISTRDKKDIVRDVENRLRKFIIDPDIPCDYNEDCKCDIHFEVNIQRKLSKILGEMEDSI